MKNSDGILPAEPTPQSPGAASGTAVEPLLRMTPRVSMRLAMPDIAQYAMIDRTDSDSVGDVLVRHDFSRIALMKGFDELLCIPNLHNVDHYWYQTETARKVLKQFRGRVLLADEVGLGKTIEAGIILKEYLTRGMVERVLILTPASLVGQWHEEMASKFDIEFVTTRHSLMNKDPKTFWSSPRIIASIATARMESHADTLAGQVFDLVIVDEAHHLKNRSSRNWKLVDALKKRFLLLLSATPVENNLIELYNLLTLLKPGLFKTEKEFRALYVKPGEPRVPLNKDRLHDLMRSAMIRNTRALVNVRLPPRHAVTLRVNPSEAEKACYHELSGLIRLFRQEGIDRHRMALHHLVETAGSSPAAVSASMGRFILHNPDLPPEWRSLKSRYEALPAGAKVEALLNLLERNPAEKKLVFVRFRETLDLLHSVLREKRSSFTSFDGRMNGALKEAAIRQFRGDVPVMLCTESGGEGHNMQFCNTLINFDLPWNPQVIEQRIGRIHRIGQQREVFVFNLATRGTVEDRILTILDEKINMFELVVGEVQSILGNMESEGDFAELVFKIWIEAAEETEKAFDDLGDKIMNAKAQYETVKAFDDELFGEEFEVV